MHKSINTFADEQDRKEMRHEEIIAFGSDINLSQEAKHETGHEEAISLGSDFGINSSQEQKEQMNCDKSISPFAAPISFRATSANHKPCSDDISDEVENADGKWPMVNSLEDLHQINKTNSALVDLLTQQHDAYEKLHETVLNICAKTMALIDVGIRDELYNNPDGDEILHALLPYYHRFLDQTKLDPTDALFDILYYGALGCMVGAFMWPRDNGNSYSHPMRIMIGIAYEMYLVLWRRAEELREQAIEEEFKQWRNDYASVDKGKEHDVDLSPAQKMRVFRNALHTMNKVGWIWYDQTHQTNRIEIKAGLARIQKLFELNPTLTPADLLPIMDGCMKAYGARPAPRAFRRGIQWHARMAHRLDIFASYLKTIVKQLEMASPVEVYLSDESILEEDVELVA